MLRSLMTAVTGVKAHQTMLDVTGNNIANVNTTGYKKDFTIFQDLLYQTTQGASGRSRGRIRAWRPWPAPSGYSDDRFPIARCARFRRKALPLCGKALGEKPSR